MNMNLDVTLQEFGKIMDETSPKIAVWGTSSCADNFVKQFNRGREFVSYYVDSSQEKWGGSIDGVEIKSPSMIFNDSSVDVVVIASVYFNDISKTLEENGFAGDVYSVIHMINYVPFERMMTVIKPLFYDDRSREIIDAICKKRKCFNKDYSDIYEPDQYFVKDIVKVDPHAVFVDAGAYHGETIDEFVKFQNGIYDKVYSFEMCAENYKIVTSRKYDERVKLFNCGLWDEKTQCNYLPNEGGSTIGKGELTTECITLDEVIGDGEVTFIKMDIEGAEMKALYGAEKCIKRCKPQLAICVYHKYNDMYDITRLLHDWLPDHKLYMRHHTKEFYDTVLYVVE